MKKWIPMIIFLALVISLFLGLLLQIAQSQSFHMPKEAKMESGFWDIPEANGFLICVGEHERSALANMYPSDHITYWFDERDSKYKWCVLQRDNSLEVILGMAEGLTEAAVATLGYAVYAVGTVMGQKVVLRSDTYPEVELEMINNAATNRNGKRTFENTYVKADNCTEGLLDYLVNMWNCDDDNEEEKQNASN